MLKQWRQRRRLSQLDLSLIAETSARHISFIEKGRSSPSREMVIKLGAAMDIPLTDVNAGLLQAGYAQAYPKADINDGSVRVLQEAVSTMLDNHLPMPAIACEQSWQILQRNQSAKHLLQLMGIESEANLLNGLLSIGHENSPLSNWPKLAQLMLRRMDAELLYKPNDEALRRVRDQLSNHPRMALAPEFESDTLNVVVPVEIKTDAVELSLISMVAQFGAVQEITYAGIHIELFFAANDSTRKYFSELSLD